MERQHSQRAQGTLITGVIDNGHAVRVDPVQVEADQFQTARAVAS